MNAQGITISDFLSTGFTQFLVLLSRCGCTFESLEQHICNGQVGGGRQRDDEVVRLPPDLDFGSFSIKFNMYNGALVGLTRDYDDVTDVNQAFEVVNHDMKMVLENSLSYMRGCSFSIILYTTMERITDGFIAKREFYAPFMRITHRLFIESKINESLHYLLSSLHLTETGGSGWLLKKVNSILLRIAVFRPRMRRGRQGGGAFIPTPPELQGRELINIETGAYCFQLSVVAGLYKHLVHLVDAPELVWEAMDANQRDRMRRLYRNPRTWYLIMRNQCARDINFSLLQGTVTLCEITKFENLNLDISISVYQHQNGDLYAVRIPNEIRERHVDLLLLEEDDLAHYVLITNLGRFYGRTNYRRTDVCRYCFAPISEFNLAHKKRCRNIQLGREISISTKDTYSFSKFAMHMDYNFKLFFHTVYYNEPVLLNEQYERKYTRQSSHAELAGYSLAVFGPLWHLKKRETYFGLDATENFIASLIKLSLKYVEKTKNTYIPLTVTDEMRHLKEITTECVLCHKGFDESRPAVYNHLHYNGELYSIICSSCNIQCIKKCVCVISHNFCERDSFFILKNILPCYVDQFDISPKQSSAILSMTWRKDVSFIDSKMLVDSSIGDMSNRMVMSANNGNIYKYFPFTTHEFSKEADPCLFTNKIEFPVRFRHFKGNTPTEFPLYEEFLGGENQLSPEEYDVCKRMYTETSCSTLAEYAKLYARASVIQLADVMLNFVQWCINSFSITPLHSPSISSFAFDAAFVKTGASFEHIKDPEMISWISDAIKAGLSFVNYPHVVANNERIGVYNGNSSERSHIIDLDLNGAYAAGASYNLAVGDYTWLSEEEIADLNISSLPDEGEYGYILEVSMYCPPDKMDYHNPLPPAVVKRRIQFNELSGYQQDLFSKMNKGLPKSETEERLILDLLPKTNYVCYHKLLKLYTQEGMIITKIHKCLRFKAAPYLKPFVDYIMSIRKSAVQSGDSFLNKICKQILCSIFGKFMTNTSNYTDVKPCGSQREFVHLTSKPTFADVSVVSDTFSLIHFTRAKIHHPHNIINAFIILENCKEMVYRGWYRMREHFNNKVRLIAGETDSMKLQIFDVEDNFLDKMMQLSSTFDFSGLPPSHVLYSSENQCRVGAWKVVALGIYEFVSIKSKLSAYSTRCDLCKCVYTPTCGYCKYYNQEKICISGLEKNKREEINTNRLKEILYSGQEDNLGNDTNKFCVMPLDIRRYHLNATESYAYGHPACSNGNNYEISSQMAQHPSSSRSQLFRENQIYP